VYKNWVVGGAGEEGVEGRNKPKGKGKGGRRGGEEVIK